MAVTPAAEAASAKTTAAKAVRRATAPSLAVAMDISVATPVAVHVKSHECLSYMFHDAA
jgi:hypothetical protein